jgi:hypothetical protein
MNFVFLRESQQRRAIHNIAEFRLGEAVWKIVFRGLVERVVGHKAAGIGIVAKSERV